MNRGEGNEVNDLSEFHLSEINFICQTAKVTKIMYYFQCLIMQEQQVDLKEHDKEQFMRSAVCYWKKQLQKSSGQQLGFCQLADQFNN